MLGPGGWNTGRGLLFGFALVLMENGKKDQTSGFGKRYGIFYFCNQYFTDTRSCDWGRPCSVGCDQSSGRIRQ